VTGIDVSLDLLDRLVIDDDGVVLGRVADVAIDSTDAGLAVVALLVGPQAWGRRFGHRLGRWITGSARTVGAGTTHIPIEDVRHLGATIELASSSSAHAGTLRSERWLRRSFIARIPGGRHASE
jgi:sporulation protein YlmC with PRC-barrel domain